VHSSFVQHSLPLTQWSVQQWSAFRQHVSPQGKVPASQQSPAAALHWPGAQHVAASPLPQQVLAIGQHSPLHRNDWAAGQHAPSVSHWPEQQPSAEQQFWASRQQSVALQTKLPSDGQQKSGVSARGMHWPGQHSPSQQVSVLAQQLSPQGKVPAAQHSPLVALHWPGAQHSASSPVPQQVLAFGQHSPLQTKSVADGQQVSPLSPRMHCPAQHSPSQQVSALAQQVSSQANCPASQQ
jgi:hypothetical protein